MMFFPRRDTVDSNDCRTLIPSTPRHVTSSMTLVRLPDRSRVFWMCMILLASLPVSISAQRLRGVVVDQTGLPLPGVAVQLLDGVAIVASLTTGADGGFDIGAALRGDIVVASLDGFETARVARQDAARIVLSIAHAAETTTVVAPELPSSSPTASAVGSILTATTVARLPSSRLKARESLPLLPSMVRGADGLLRLGGARPYQTPLLLDGFNVTNPATGTSTINLPFEAVQGVEVLRNPMAVVYGGLLGGLVQMVSKPGTDKLQYGVQGFIPRPRFVSPGFGRLEGIFPRVFAGGRKFGGRLRYFGAVEYDFERIAVPEVTTGSGPNLLEQSATLFGRIDVQAHDRYNLTIEGLAFPSTTENLGLSLRREEPATATISQRDLFAGMTNRIILDNASVLAINVSVLTHDTTLSPNGAGPARLSPLGWRANWFASIERHAVRYSMVGTWNRRLSLGQGDHSLTLTAHVAPQRLRGTVAEGPVLVEDIEGRVVRRVEFGPPSTLSASDRPMGFAMRDVWSAGDRLQVDARSTSGSRQLVQRGHAVGTGRHPLGVRRRGRHGHPRWIRQFRRQPAAGSRGVRRSSCPIRYRSRSPDRDRSGYDRPATNSRAASAAACEGWQASKSSGIFDPAWMRRSVLPSDA